MASESSAPKLRAAERYEPEPSDRPKRLRVLSRISLASEGTEGRRGSANRRAALKLLQLREETGLTQVDTAALTGDGQRTIGAYERAEVDLGPLRVFVELLEFRARQKGGR